MKTKNQDQLLNEEIKRIKKIMNLTEMVGMDDDVEDFEDDVDMEKENPKDDLIDYTLPDWAVAALVNADYSGLTDEEAEELDAFSNRVKEKYGNAHFMLGDIDGEDDLGFVKSTDLNNMGANAYRVYIKPSNDINSDNEF